MNELLIINDLRWTWVEFWWKVFALQKLDNRRGGAPDLRRLSREGDLWFAEFGVSISVLTPDLPAFAKRLYAFL